MPDQQLNPQGLQDPIHESIPDNRPPVTSERHAHDDVHLTWEASEYVMHHKPSSWYVLFGLGVLALSAILFFLTKDIFSVVVVVLMSIAMLIYAVRQPHTLQYSISDSSIIVGHKEFTYNEFKSFSIMHDGSFYNVTLTPTKRLAAPLSIYFDEQDAEQIMELLSRHLPHVEKELDPIDKISRYLRF